MIHSPAVLYLTADFSDALSHSLIEPLKSFALSFQAISDYLLPTLNGILEPVTEGSVTNEYHHWVVV